MRRLAAPLLVIALPALGGGTALGTAQSQFDRGGYCQTIAVLVKRGGPMASWKVYKVTGSCAEGRRVMAAWHRYAIGVAPRLRGWSCTQIGPSASDHWFDSSCRGGRGSAYRMYSR